VRSVKKVWKVESEFFSGTVQLDPGMLAPGEIRVVYGKIVLATQTNRYELRTVPPKEWDESIQLLCTQLNGKDGKDVQMMFLNKGSNNTQGKVVRWTSFNDYFSKDFFSTLFSRPVGPGEIIQHTQLLLTDEMAAKIPVEARWGTLESDEDFEACAPPRETLTRALAQEVRCDVPVIVRYEGSANWNNIEDETLATEKVWKTPDNPMFVATISSRLESCMPDGDPRVVAGVTALTLKDWVEIREPSISDGEFDLLGYNILDDGRISLVLRNRDQFNSKSVGDKGRDWSYALIAYRPKSHACDPRVSARACLVFSYLVMDPVQFNNSDTNVILRDINTRFKKENGEIGVDPLPGGIRIPGR
jgi:hypothetical protein